MKGVYIIHFEDEVKTNSCGDSKHYVGMSQDVFHRLFAHFQGRGSVTTRKAHAAHNRMTVVAIYPEAGVELEKVLSKGKTATDNCHICTIK